MAFLGEVVDSVGCGEGYPPGYDNASGNATDDEPVYSRLFLGHPLGVDQRQSSRADKDTKPRAFIGIPAYGHFCAGHFLEVSSQVVRRRHPTSILASVNHPPHDRRTLWRQRGAKIAVESRDLMGKSRDEGVRRGWKQSQEGRSEGCIRGGRGSNFLSAVHGAARHPE